MYRTETRKTKNAKSKRRNHCKKVKARKSGQSVGSGRGKNLKLFDGEEKTRSF